jgi:hypothetical protein
MSCSIRGAAHQGDIEPENSAHNPVFRHTPEGDQQTERQGKYERQDKYRDRSRHSGTKL